MANDPLADGEAIISPCGMYRYTLHRRIPSVLRWVRPVLFIMLNPSTADAVRDDPTIRRCISFTKDMGGTSLTVVNLFAFRSASPLALKTMDDPIGPDNDRHIEEQVERHRLGVIVAAWGAHPFAKARADEVMRKFGPFQCLGMTKAGHPKHPLYLKAKTELVPLGL
jgi:hypothetical protein